MRESITHIAERALDQSKISYYWVMAPIIGCAIGLLIVQDNPVLLLVGFFLASRLIIFSNAKIMPYVIIFSVFFSDWLSSMGLIPSSFTWLPDVALLVFTVKVFFLRFIDKKIIKTQIDIPIIFFLLWAAISMIVNSTSFIGAFYSGRQLLKFVLMFYLFVNFNYNETFIKKLNILLVGLFLIQVPTALIKMLIYGKGEEAIGTYARYGAALSAILPLFVNAVCLGFYLFYKGKSRFISFFLYFQLFYFACPKRIYPIFAIITIAYLILISGKQNIKKFLPLTPLLILFTTIILYINPNLNLLLSNPKRALDWVTSYTYQKTEDVTSGRVAVAELAIQKIMDSPHHLLFGYGPGTMTEGFQSDKDSIYRSLSIYYGLTEFTIMLLEYGIVGVMLFLYLLIRIYKVTHEFFMTIEDPYWKAIAFGYKGIWLACILAYFYTPIFRLDLSGFIFWFGISAIVVISNQKNILGNALRTNEYQKT